MRLASLIRRPIVWFPVSVALLALLVWRSRVWEAGAAIQGGDLRAVLAATALSAVIAVVWAIRSARLFSAVGRAIAVRPLIPMTTFANTINNLTPGSAGELVRMYLLRAHHDVDYATSGAVVFIERIGAIGYLTSTALVAWLAWLGVVSAAASAVLLVLLVVGPVAAYRVGLRPLSIVGRLPLGRLVGEARWRTVGAWFGRVDSTVALVIRDPIRLIQFVVLSCLIFAASTGQLLLLGAALGVRLDPLAAWGALGLSTTVGVLSLLPFGIGTTDLALAALLGLTGIPPATAAAMAFGYRLVSTLPLSIAGIVSFAWLSARLPQSGLRGAANAVRAEVGEAPTLSVGP